MLRHQHTEPDENEVEVALHVEALRRKVAWQVSAAYGLPLEEVRVPVVATRESPVVVPLRLPDPEPQLEPEPAPLPQPEPEVVPAAAVAVPAEPVAPVAPVAPVERPSLVVLPTLPELERRVAQAAKSQPELAEEWRWYLFYLRDFARTDGTLDNSFRLLIETAFAPLLERVA